MLFLTFLFASALADGWTKPGETCQCTGTAYNRHDGDEMAPMCEYYDERYGGRSCSKMEGSRCSNPYVKVVMCIPQPFWREELDAIYAKLAAEREQLPGAESAVGETCACAGGNQKGTKSGDKVCQWSGGNCSKYREGCDKHGATICTMHKDAESEVGLRNTNAAACKKEQTGASCKNAGCWWDDYDRYCYPSSAEAAVAVGTPVKKIMDCYRSGGHWVDAAYSYCSHSEAEEIGVADPCFYSPEGCAEKAVGAKSAEFCAQVAAYCNTKTGRMKAKCFAHYDCAQTSGTGCDDPIAKGLWEDIQKEPECSDVGAQGWGCSSLTMQECMDAGNGIEYFCCASCKAKLATCNYGDATEAAIADPCYYRPEGCAEAQVGTSMTFPYNVKGWCVKETHRKYLGSSKSKEECLSTCAWETWNGKAPTGCEFSANYRTCNVFWGGSVSGSQSGGSYICSLAKDPYAKFRRGDSNKAEEAVSGFYTDQVCTKDSQCVGMAHRRGTCDTSKNRCHFGSYASDAADTKVGKIMVANWGGCTSVQMQHGCYVDDDTFNCMCPLLYRPKNAGESAVGACSGDDLLALRTAMYDDTATCSAAISGYAEYGVDLCEKDHWMGLSEACCATCATRAAQASTVAMTTTSQDTPLVVTVFAAVGLSAMLYGAFRHYTKQ